VRPVGGFSGRSTRRGAPCPHAAARRVSSEDTPLRGADTPLRGLCGFGEHTPLRGVRSDDMPLRGMSSHTAARCCRVSCGWGSTATSTHENENPAYNNFAQGVDMPRQTAKPAAACSSTHFYSVKRLPSGRHSARHACLALVTPTAYRAVLPFSRTAWCSACASGRSQPCYSSQSPFVGRSVGGPRHAPTE
jgi:hypothetical protein